MQSELSHRRRRVPNWLKWTYLGFVLVLVPVYSLEHGLKNFLWFSNVALLLGLLGVWTENRLIVSTQAVSVSLLETLWLVDFTAGLLRRGEVLVGMAEYMFDPELPLIVRLLSLYHVVLPFLLLWLVWRLGYDRRAWRVWIIAGWTILLLAFFTPGDRNVNWVYGLGREGEQVLPARAWLPLVMLACATVWTLTHLAILYAMPRLGGRVV